MEFYNENCKQVLAYDLNSASSNFADQFRYEPSSNMYVVAGRYFELLVFLVVLCVCVYMRVFVC